MAPEIIQEKGHNCKVDIWSLGITIIEMIEGKPPLSHLHPLKAIFSIPSNPPPQLKNPKHFSKEFVDFLALCLKKNTEERPTATELLQLEIIKNAKNTKDTLVDLIQLTNEKKRREKTKQKKIKKIQRTHWLI
eukprot:Anaeramoba_flamelloidesc35680_g1_i3.p1 GENE.c35680_g1_i3~~c35680_g1_i3.p1  ORF type:complete len:133 (+),score=36.31 c35680_g1_i3:175-573(+)